MIHVLLGISMSGVSLATENIGMKLAPRGRGTAYLAGNGLVGAIAAGVAPLLGGALANALADYRLILTLDLEGPAGVLSIPTFHLQGIDFAFLLAFLVGVYADAPPDVRRRGRPPRAVPDGAEPPHGGQTPP